MNTKQRQATVDVFGEFNRLWNFQIVFWKVGLELLRLIES